MKETTENRRRVARQRILKGAQIIFKGGATTIDCTVRDISATGARLKVASPIGIPETFDLAVEGAPVGHCHVVWRKPDQIGVEFA
jgi:hypothetical protein